MRWWHLDERFALKLIQDFATLSCTTSSHSSPVLDICLTTRGCLTSTHTPTGLTSWPQSSGQLAKGRHFPWARGEKEGETDEAERGMSQSDVTDANWKLWNWMITGLSVFGVCLLLVLAPLWCLLMTPEALGQLPEFTWKKKKTPPALSLNTWWPNQFQIPFAYRYYPQAAVLRLFLLTREATLNPWSASRHVWLQHSIKCKGFHCF